MKTSPELQKAVTEYQKGSVEAFNIIYEQSYKYLHTCVIHVVKNEDMAMDMLQETYLEISKSISQLKSTEDFLSWAAMIANRKCFAHLKKQKDILLDGSGFGDSDTEDNVTDYFENIADNEEFIPETVLQDREKQRLIKEIIDGLNDMQRLCVIGFYYNEQKQEEIAEELGIPVNTVKSHLNRAKAKIKEAVVELDVKKGTRLYSFAPFMALLFREEVQACVLRPMSKGLASAVGVSAGVGSGALGEFIGELGVKVKALLAKFTTASVKTKAVVATTACAVTIGGAAVALHSEQEIEVLMVETVEETVEEKEEVITEEQIETYEITQESKVLLDQIIELCRNSQPDRICTLDFTELINAVPDEERDDYMWLNFCWDNGEMIPAGYFYDGVNCQLVENYSGYGAEIVPWTTAVAVGEFKEGRPTGTLYVIEIDYTTNGYAYRTENEFFIQTQILELAAGEKAGKEKTVLSLYAALSDVYEDFPESLEMVRYEGIISPIEGSRDFKYQFTGEIIETGVASDFSRTDYRIVLDGNGKMDFNVHKVEFIPTEYGYEIEQFYDADGNKLRGTAAPGIYEGCLEYPYVGHLPHSLEHWLDE